jgi:hypothetical protein
VCIEVSDELVNWAERKVSITVSEVIAPWYEEIVSLVVRGHLLDIFPHFKRFFISIECF